MELATVFRSADHNAEEQAAEVRDLLREAGLRAQLFSSRDLGIAEGTWEVRVPSDQTAEAERLIAENRALIEQPMDTSHELDMVTVFQSDAHNAEMLAAGIQSLLEANGIPCVILSPGPIPSLPFEVRVPRSRLEEAQAAIRAAEEAGPAAAEEASRMSEGEAL